MGCIGIQSAKFRKLAWLWLPLPLPYLNLGTRIFPSYLSFPPPTSFRQELLVGFFEFSALVITIVCGAQQAQDFS